MLNTTKYKKIIFFCEKSKKIGGGHFIRTKRLKEIIGKKYRSYFYNNLSLKKIINLVKQNNNSIIVFDFKKYSKKIFIKDLENFYVVFDNNKKFLKNSVNINPLYLKKKKFCGPKWFLYPKNFSKILKKKRRKKINVFICQGFTDAHNNINKIVEILRKSPLDKNIKIYTKVPYKNYLKKRFLRNKNIIEINKFKNLFTFLNKMDIAITSTGNFSYEIGYCQIPSLFISEEFKEKMRGKIYQKKGLGKIFSSKNELKILEEFKKLCYNYNYYIKIKKNLKKYFKRNSEKNYLDLFRKINKNEKV